MIVSTYLAASIARRGDPAPTVSMLTMPALEPSRSLWAATARLHHHYHEVAIDQMHDGGESMVFGKCVEPVQFQMSSYLVE